ncbi:hypothetical protein Q8F55_002932 [Vanrija albida]|uniref:Protein CPL1-like domain-containing protein n=1 Tax=Vanrija albida TaxID=181172 RepID=A0ABR3QB33_9TREE
MRSPLLFITAALSAASIALAQSSTFVGCYLLSASLSFSLFTNVANAGLCRNYCFGQNNLYAFYSTTPFPLQPNCFCSALHITSLGLSPTVGSQTTCSGLGQFHMYDLQTTFVNAGCNNGGTVTLNPADVSNPQTLSGSLQDCFSFCANYLHVLATPGTLLTGLLGIWTCKCLNNLPTMSQGATCTSSNPYLFSHPLSATGQARRRVIQDRRNHQQLMAANPYCPPGRAACNVSPDITDGYECLNVAHELESCGGCKYGHYRINGTGTIGIDCTAIEGVDRHAVGCFRGECAVLRCMSGYTLENGACYRTLSIEA